VVKADALYFLCFDKVEDALEIGYGMARQREAEPRLLTDLSQVTKGRNRLVECTGPSSELIVRLTDSIE
jgi:hypothetical protein